MSKTHIAIMLVGLLFFVVATSCNDDDVIESMDAISSNRAFPVMEMACQEEANVINHQILDGLCLNSRSDNTNPIYPNYYGGSYIEPDGNLIIYIVGDSIYGTNAIKSITTNPIVKFKCCEYSYQSLINVLDEIYEAVKTAPKTVAKNVTAFGLNQKMNCVNVCLADISESRIDEFKQIYNNPSVSFLQMNEVEYQSTNVYPGNKLCLSSSTCNSYGSIGFRVREKSGSKRTGFVTAGHVIDKGESCFVDRNNVGLCVSSEIYGAKADAAFIVAEKTTTLQNYINGDTNAVLSTKTDQPGEGTLVNLWGAQSGHTWGYISNTKYYITKGGVVVTTDLVAAEYPSDEGDSGGVIYTYISSTGIRYTVGIHLGTASDPKTGKSYSIYSKADNVLNMFNLERY